MKTVICPECGREFESLGFASHRASHRRKREVAKKLKSQTTTRQFITTVFETEHGKRMIGGLSDHILDKSPLDLRLDTIAKIAKIADMDLRDLVTLLLKIPH